jgi:hypothetical protein
MCGIKPFARRSWQVSARKGVFQRTEHKRERRAKFVADVGEEQCFGAIDFCESLRTFAFKLVGAGIRNRCADLPGNQIEKAGIIEINDASRAKARYEKAGCARLSRRCDGHDQGSLRRFGP